MKIHGGHKAELTVRQARSVDLAQVRDCIRQAYEPYLEEIGVRPAPLDDDYAKLIASGKVYVLEDDDGPSIAAVLVMCFEADHLLLDNLAVSPLRQNQGLGQRFLEFAAAIARRRGTCKLRLYTNAKMKKNLALYQRLGFEIIDRKSEKGFDRVYMEKELS